MFLNKYLRILNRGHINYAKSKPYQKLRYLPYIPKDVSTILDAGCGKGELIFLLKQKGYKMRARAKAVSKKYVLLAIPNARYVLQNERETHLYSWNSSTILNLLKKAGLTTIKLSEDPVNLFPNIIRVSPILSRVLSKLFWNPMEIICLARK